jgi:hypothetical protein
MLAKLNFHKTKNDFLCHFVTPFEIGLSIISIEKEGRRRAAFFSSQPDDGLKIPVGKPSERIQSFLK